MALTSRLLQNALVVLGLAVVGLVSDPAAARVLTLDDLDGVSSVSAPQISPDGRSVVVVVSTPDYEVNRFVRRLVLVDVASGRTRNLTTSRPTVSRPRWSPSGHHLAFLANGADKDQGRRQVFLLPSDGGEARQLTRSSTNVGAFEWSADGEEITYIAAGTKPEPPEGPERHNKAFVVTHHDYLAQRAPAPLNVWRQLLAGGEPTRVNGDDVHPLGGQFSWLSVSDDGRSVVFPGFPAAHPGDFTKAELVVLDLKSGRPREFGGNRRSVGWGALSPDGSRLAFSQPEQNIWGYRPNHIAISRAGKKPAQRLTTTIDRSLWGATWMPDGQGLLVGGRDGARNSIWYQPLKGEPQRLALGELEARTGYGPVDLDVGAQGQIAFTATTTQKPTELYWLASIDAKPRQLTRFNDALSKVALGTAEEITWQTEDGFEANGILTYPPGFTPKKRYPLVFAIHGGPMSASTLRFDQLNQLMAAQGFVVFSPNYRGSDNLGARYQGAIIDDAGAGPGRDVMAGLKAIQARGFIDEDRIGVSGWSYGGYMTAWLIGNYPEVWRAAMAGAPVTDYVDQYALSDLNNLFGGGFSIPPWRPEAQDAWGEQAPISYAHRITTPTLILCNTGDLRVPITESYKLYHAINDQDVPVQFVAYPLPGHFPGDPVHRRDVFKRWVDWMVQRFKQPRGAPVAAGGSAAAR